jgi:hypothetical protein
MAISNITAPRTMSIEAMRPVLDRAMVFVSFIPTAAVVIPDPVAVAVLDMRYPFLQWSCFDDRKYRQ